MAVKVKNPRYMCVLIIPCIYCRFDPDHQFWHSSLITERLHHRVVCSTTGTTYKLVGKIVKPLALAQGISNSCGSMIFAT